MPYKLHQTSPVVEGSRITNTVTVVLGLSANRFRQTVFRDTSTTHYLPYETLDRAEEASTVVQRPTSRGLVTQVLADLPKVWEIAGTIRARDTEETALDAVRDMRDVQRDPEQDAEVLLEYYRHEDTAYVSESITPVVIQSVQVGEPVEPVGGSAIVVQYTIRLEEQGEA